MAKMPYSLSVNTLVSNQALEIVSLRCFKVSREKIVFLSDRVFVAFR